MSVKDVFILAMVLAYVVVFREPGQMTWITNALIGLTAVLMAVKYVLRGKNQGDK